MSSNPDAISKSCTLVSRPGGILQGFIQDFKVGGGGGGGGGGGLETDP